MALSANNYKVTYDTYSKRRLRKTEIVHIG